MRQLAWLLGPLPAPRWAPPGLAVRTIGAVAQFLGLIANGLAFTRVAGDPLPDLDVLDELVRTGANPS